MPTPNYASVRQAMERVGLRTASWSNVVIAAEVLERGIKLSTIGIGAKVKMRHNGTKHFWRHGRNSLNSPLAKKCADFKDVTNSLLRASGVHAPENAVFAAGEAERAWAWAEPISPVVVKPNNGMQGEGVFVNISTWEDFQRAFETVTSSKGDALVEKFHPGEDHRVFVVDGKVIAATRRIPAHVVGDGESSIAALVEQKNQQRPTVHKKLVIDEVSSRHIAGQGLTWDSTPAADTTVYLRGTANLHTGGDSMDATDLLTAGQIDYVERAAAAIPGLRVAGFDLLIPTEDPQAASTVLEINENPMISMHHFPAIGKVRNPAGAVLNAMFPNTARPVTFPANSPH